MLPRCAGKGVAYAEFTINHSIWPPDTKQKFYDNIDVSPEVKRLFIDQIRLITWAHKLSAQTMNLADGQAVQEIEVFHIKLLGDTLDPRVTEQMDKQIPYHILFVLERPDGMVQLVIRYKEAAQAGENAFRLQKSYATDWQNINELSLPVNALDMDSLYESIVRFVAGDALTAAPDENLKTAIEQTQAQENLRRQLEQLKSHMKKEKQLSRQMELRRQIKQLEKQLNNR